MSSLKDKLAAFRQAAGSHGVQVNIHPVNPDQPPRRLRDRVMLYSVLAGAVSAAAVSFALKTPEVVLVDASTHHHYWGTPAPPDLASQQAPPVARMREPGQDPGQIEASAPDAASDPWQAQPMRELRQRVSYVEVEFAGRRTLTLDAASRVALSKWAAEQHQLHRQGLSWRDLYGTIQAETDWIARDGMGKNGVVSTGLSQLEPATARSLGITDPKDPIQAVHAAASLLKEAAAWSRAKVAHLPAQARANALRDGLSVYYNLSTRGRNAWDGTNAADLPTETQQHIRNARQGVKNATYIENQMIRAQARLERERSQQQSTQATQTIAAEPMRVAVSARIDGAPDQSVLSAGAARAQDESAPMQFSSRASIDALRGVLERPCAVQVTQETIVQYNTACMFANRKPADPMGLPRAAPGGMLVGYFDRVPVIVVEDDSLSAEAHLIPNQPEMELFTPEQPGAFNANVLSSSLVERLAHNPVALEFLLAHENGHHRRNHRDQGNHQIMGAGLHQEREADYEAFMRMSAHGRGPDEIAAAASLVFDVLRNSPVVKELPILQLALDARQKALAGHIDTARELQAQLQAERRQLMAQR